MAAEEMTSESILSLLNMAQMTAPALMDDDVP